MQLAERVVLLVTGAPMGEVGAVGKSLARRTAVLATLVAVWWHALLMCGYITSPLSLLVYYHRSPPFDAGAARLTTVFF